MIRILTRLSRARTGAARAVLPLGFMSAVALSGCGTLTEVSGNVSEYFTRSTTPAPSQPQTDSAAVMDKGAAPAAAVAADRRASPAGDGGDAGALEPVRSAEPLQSFGVEDRVYASEDQEYGTPLFTSLIPPRYPAKTPVMLPGSTRIDTYDLYRMLSQPGKGAARPVLINVQLEAPAEIIGDAVWLSGAGIFGRMDDAVQPRLEQHLAALSGGNLKRPLVFYCEDLSCWLAFNAGQRAITLGYRNVHWYRGGLRAWYEAGLPTSPSEQDIWGGGQSLSRSE